MYGTYMYMVHICNVIHIDNKILISCKESKIIKFAGNTKFFCIFILIFVLNIHYISTAVSLPAFFPVSSPFQFLFK